MATATTAALESTDLFHSMYLSYTPMMAMPWLPGRSEGEER
jgi:hypothetical protein